MQWLVLVCALLPAMIVHEAAHAVAMRKHGILIEEAGLGLPFAPRAVFRTRWGWKLSLSPWIVAAYVSAGDDGSERMAALPYRKHAWILNAGIVVNLVTGFAAACAVKILNGQWLAAGVLSLLFAGFWLGRRLVASHVLPALAPLALMLLLFGLYRSVVDGRSVGLVGTAEVMPADFTAIDMLIAFAVVSVALALFNMLPLFGLDNGKVVGLILARKLSPSWVERYETVGAVAVVGTIVIAVISDVWHIIF